MPRQSPSLVLGNFSVTENSYLAITAAEINASDADTSQAAHLLFEISDLKGGRFILSGLKVTQFTLADILAERVAFKHDGKTVSPSFSISVSDAHGSTSPSTPVNILIDQSNDNPVIVAKATSLGRGRELVLTSTVLKITDEESSPADLTVSVLSASHLSVLRKLAVGVEEVDSFTVEELNSGKILVRHDNSTNAPRLLIQVDDPDGGSSRSSLSFRFTDTVGIAGNTAAVIDSAEIKVRDGQTITVTGDMIRAHDDNSDSGGLLLNVVNLKGGQFYLSGVKATIFSMGDIEAGLVTFKHYVNQAVPDFQLNIRDSHGKISATPFAARVQVESVNEAPGLWIRPVVMNEGGTVVFNDKILLVIDGDSPDVSLQFQAADISHGRLLVNDLEASTFTLAEVRAGKVKFVHDGSEEAPTLAFSLKDEASYSLLINVPFQFKHVNDLPLIYGSDLICSPQQTISLNTDILGASDIETRDPAELVFKVASISRGQFLVGELASSSFTLADLQTEGRVKFKHTGGQGSKAGFSLQLNDEDGGIASLSLVTIDDLSSNEFTPVLSLSPLAINEGAAVNLKTLIEVSDGDPGTRPESLRFEIESISQGKILRGLAEVQSFTLKDLQNDLIRFVHDGSETAPQLILSVGDGKFRSLPMQMPISFSNVNDAPTAIALDQATVAENLAGARIGSLTVSDADLADSHSFTVSDSRFEVVGGDLKLKDGISLNYEQASAINLLITATDLGGRSTREFFSLTVTNLNDAPGDIRISNLSIHENISGAVIGTIYVKDEDADDSFTFSVDDSRFEVLFGQLKLKDGASLSYGSNPVIQITAQDQGGASISRSFTVAVKDSSEVINFTLSSTSVSENLPGGIVGQLVFPGNDGGSVTSYTVSDSRFEIVSGQVRLKAGVALNAELGDSLNLSITAKTANGFVRSKNFNISVLNVNESPSDIRISNLIIDDSPGALIGKLQVIDPDLVDTHSYILSDSRFEVVNGTLKVKDGQSILSGPVTLSITATDSGSLSTSKSFTFSVRNLNDAPTAIQLSHTSVNENQPGAGIGKVTVIDPNSKDVFSFVLSDSRFEIVNGDLRLKAGVSLNFENEAAIPLVITATDRGGLSVSQSFNLSVNNVNEAPNGLSLSAASLAENTAGAVIGSLSPSDPEGGPFTYLVNDPRFEVVGGLLKLKAASSLDFETSGGSVSVGIRVTDGGGLSFDKSFLIAVTDLNDAPSGQLFATGILRQGETLSVINQIQDQDGLGTFTYEWFDALSNRLGSGETLILTEAEVGKRIRVVANYTDGHSHSESVLSPLSSPVANVNDAPSLASAIPDQTATEDSPFSYVLPSAAFADVDAGDSLTYSAKLEGGSPLPLWLNFNAGTQTFSGTPLNFHVGSLNIVVTATDNGGLKVSDTFTLTVNNSNDAPTVAAPISGQSATEDSAFSFTIPLGTFADVDASDSLSFSASLANGNPLPSWLNFNAATRTFSGTPLNADVGVIGIKVVASDISGASVSNSFLLNVADTNDAPMLLNPIADQSATQDSLFTFVLPPDSFADIDAGDALSFSATLQNGSPLPSWLNFNPITRSFSGTPANADLGLIDVTVTAKDSSNLSVSDTFSLNVANINDAPTLLNAIANQAVNEDSTFNFSIPDNTFNDVDLGESLTLSAKLQSGNPLPSWLSFNAATKTFSGTPINADVGNLSIVVTAEDSQGASVTDTFTLSVANVNDAPTVANLIADQSATEDSAFSFVLPLNTFADADLGDSLTLSATLANGNP
ncbi:MAG: hypothetical protein RL095_2230, partial [Verrucomicrobiota bacterium]